MFVTSLHVVLNIYVAKPAKLQFYRRLVYYLIGQARAKPTFSVRAWYTNIAAGRVSLLLRGLFIGHANYVSDKREI